MTAKEWAKKLNNTEYRNWDKQRRFDADLARDGLIVIAGESDDLLEFYGAIDYEAQAWGGTVVRIGRYEKGKNVVFRVVEHNKYFGGDGYDMQDANKIYRVRAVWCPDDMPKNTSWKIDSEVPHETFDIVEGGDIFCRGIIISVDNL